MGNTQHVTDSKHTQPVSLDNENFSFGSTTLKNPNSSQENVLADSANQTVRKAGNKKKGRTKDKKKDDSFSYRNNFSTDELDNKTDMFEISPDEDFDRLYSQTQSPDVPELIVDVLKAEVSSDRSDGYSTIRSLDMNFLNPNSAETRSDDDQDHQQDVKVLNDNETVNKDVNRNIDPGLNYPIIFRRSKKDPGSKQYNELVKELSSVLKKRSETARAQSMHEDTSEASLGVDLKTVSLERKQISKSSQNLNVFANKSLLSKLENHIANRHLANKLATDERQENGSGDIRKINTSSDYSLRINVGSDGDVKSGNMEAVSNSYDVDSLYSKPMKQKTSVTNSGVAGTTSETTNAVSNKVDIHYDKRASAETYNQADSFSKETTKTYFDRSFPPEVTTFPKPVISAYEGHDIKSSTRMMGSSAEASKQDVKIRAANDNMTQYRHYNHSDQQQQLHKVSEMTNSNARHEINRDHDFRHTTSNTRNGSVIVNDLHNAPVSSSANGQSTVTFVRLNGHITDNSWTNSQGHSTNFTVSGRGLSRQNKFMNSEPDLTRVGSLSSDTSNNKHIGSRYGVTPGRTSPEIVLSSELSTSARTKQYVANHHHHHHYRSLDNLLSDSSSEKSGNVYVVSSANTSFLHNYSYDVSFDHESFDDHDDFHSGQSDASGSLNSHVVKVNIGSTYFGSTSDSYSHTLDNEDPLHPVNTIRFSDNGYTSLPRTESRTTITEHSKNISSDTFSAGNNPAWPSSFTEHSQSLDRRTIVPRATSQKSASSSSSSHASSRSKIARSQTLERNLHHQCQADHPQNHLYIKHSTRRNASFTADPGHPKSDGSTAGSSSPDLSASKLFVVVPPQPHQIRVPDLIVDHQQTQQQKQQQGGYCSSDAK